MPIDELLGSPTRPFEIVIIGGRDEDDLREQLSPMIGPDTVVRDAS